MKKIFVNLKDWLNLEENVTFIKNSQKFNVTVFPSLPYLHLYKESVSYDIGVQDISINPSGAYTGHCSLNHLQDFNIKWAIINHKETKRLDSETIYKKIKLCKTNNINVILCISEITEQELNTILAALSKLDNYDNIFIAYEPICDDLETNVDKDMEYLSLFFQDKFQHKFLLIYGGNLSHKNIVKYLNNDHIDGFLISRHALDIEELKTIINLVK